MRAARVGSLPDRILHDSRKSLLRAAISDEFGMSLHGDKERASRLHHCATAQFHLARSAPPRPAGP